MHFKNSSLLLLILCIAILSEYPLLASEVILSENDNSNKRPKTALVLSGGGARGAAHVGVLKVLEELNIPVDFVVGTSMGSIVGGLYSSGYSPDEIEQLLKTIDWDKALQDKPPRKILSYKRKKDDQNLLGLEVGFKDGKFTLPEGAIAGQELGFILKSSLHRVSSIKSFNQLPIPFIAVATDIETGELVPISFGDLSDAIRASMSVPGVFTPVNIDGRKLVDGGLVSNLPVQVARNMGADRVIAVDIGSGLYDEDKLESILGVSLQMISVLMKQNVDNSIVALEAGDIYLRPDLGGFSSTNFKEAHTIIKNGYDEADSMRIRLRDFSISQNAYAQWQKTQRLAEPVLNPKIDFIKVVGNERVSAEQIIAHLKLYEGDEFNKKRLNLALERVYSIGDFETVSYNLLEKNSNSVDLEITVKEKPWGPNYIRGAVRISDDFDGGGSYNLLVNHRLTQINHLGGVWENTLEIGKRRSFSSEFYQPLLYSGRFFISPQLELADDVIDIYENNNRVGEYNVDSATLKLDFGWTPQNDSEVRLGLEYAKIKGRLRVGQTSTILPDVDADIGAITFLAGLDRQDSPYFPTQGLQATLAVKSFKDALGSDDEYNTAEFETGKFWNKGKSVYGLNLSLSSSFDSDLPLYSNFSLGGLGRLSGLNLNQLLGEHAGLANAVYYRPIGEKFPGNIGFTLEAGNVWNESDDIKLDNLIYSGSIFWSLDSVLGALYLGYGITDDGETALHLNLGQPF